VCSAIRILSNIDHPLPSGRATLITAGTATDPRVSREDINKRSDDDMDKDRIAGAAKESKGAIKEATGKVLGDAKLTADGKSDKAEGKVQNAIGGLKDALKK
jgi:uncharacterized protein YjbJ (UPF0337 family)